MARMDVTVNGHSYTIACDEGEERHLGELAGHVDAKVRELLGTVGQAGEARLLLMAALLIADDYFDAAAQLERRAKEIDDLAGAQEESRAKRVSAEETAARALETAARRVEDIAARLAPS